MSDTATTFRMETHPNPHIRTFHTRAKRPDAELGGLLGDDIGDLKNPSDRLLIKSLAAIHGVVTVSFYNYQVSIEKGEAFEWDEITPGITAALQGAAKTWM